MNATVPLNMPYHRRLRIDDFLVLSDAGVFSSSAKAELIAGEIVEVNAQYLRHSYVKNELGFRLRLALQGMATDLIVLIEVSVAMPPNDLPEPDIVLTRSELRDRAVALPSVGLIVEVADTTREFDLGRKALLYAGHGVPEYWVADLEQRRVVRHWRPEPDGFAEKDAVAFGEQLPSVTIAGLAVATDGLD